MVRDISIAAIPLLLAIILHEVSHGWVANRRGDSTARLSGRLTLNPLAHIDLYGTILMPILLLALTQGRFVFGYAKPVPVNFMNLRRPKEDMILVAGAGPATNLALAAVCGILFRTILILDPDLWRFLAAPPLAASGGAGAMLLLPILLMLVAGVKWNVLLAIFNMIPMPPLDGGRVLVGLLPDRPSAALASIEPYGFLVVMALVFLDPLSLMSEVVFPIMRVIGTAIAGIDPFAI